MHILVTNDDGVSSPGLVALGAALRRLGTVTVFAPDHNWSAAGHNKTMHKPLRVESVQLSDGSPALASNGTPSDCVAMAVLGVVGRPIDLVVSGINAGPNLGQDITYSGTVAGAMEATINGLPAIAVSLASYNSELDFGPAAEVAAAVAETAHVCGLPPDVFLNVNVPPGPEAARRDVRLTRLGRRVYRDVLLRREDPRGRPYYWIGGDPPTGEPEPDTDIWALEHGLVSITPIHMDMTAYPLLNKEGEWRRRLLAALSAGRGGGGQ
ncbi:MAG: 5'/3'-nucleotidase SurE [Anaerolineae bacterium]|nr:5'/3'-nucleotidase SurE [Anaerolineae bacterium]